MNAPDLIQHSSASVEHYTPAEIVERARRVLGVIDLDPASCEEANKVVQARAIYTREQNGLRQSWCVCERAHVWLNPPGGKLHRETLQPIEKGPGLSAAAVWWAKLWHEWNIGNVRAGIFLGFSLNILQNGQGLEGVPAPQSFPFVVPKQRIAFEGPGKRSGPSHPNAIVLVSQEAEYETRFEREFSELGYVVFPKRR